MAWTEPQSLREGPANAQTPPVGGTERPQGLRVQSKGKIGGWVKGTGGSNPPLQALGALQVTGRGWL